MNNNFIHIITILELQKKKLLPLLNQREKRKNKLLVIWPNTNLPIMNKDQLPNQIAMSILTTKKFCQLFSTKENSTINNFRFKQTKRGEMPLLM